jgi:hypothetical protein
MAGERSVVTKPQSYLRSGPPGSVGSRVENDPVTRNGPGHQHVGPGHNNGPPLAPSVRRRGRPSKSTSELRERILDQLAEGKPIRRICAAPGMPSSETLRCWRQADPEFARHFELAQKFGWHLLTEDLVEKVNAACDQGNVARARLIFNAGRWYLARQAPGFFGGGW